MTGPVLDVRNVDFAYRPGEAVLRRVSFSVGEREIVGLIGPNGSGKSTLLRVLDGLLKPAAGAVLLRGRPVSRIGREELARTVAAVPQEQPVPFPYRVREIVMMGRFPHLKRFHFEGPDDIEIVREAMEMTGVGGLADRKMGELSGGERQRVWIARALAQEPEVMLLDECTVFLDIRHQLLFFDLLHRLHRTRGIAVLFVTHDVNLAARYAGRLVLLDRGEVRAAGPVWDVLTERNIRGVYGTEVLVDRHPSTGTPRVTTLAAL